MAAIAVPIIIHWWNNRQRKTLLVGSITFMEVNARQRVQNWSISELPLLLLRCLLLLLLAMVLAQPVWKRIQTANTGKGWLLMERNNLPQAYHQHKLLIDSLVQAGYEFHYFEPGFTKEQWQQAVDNKSDTAATGTTSYRALFTAVDKQAPTAIPLYIISSNRLQYFNGNQPATARQVKWLTYTPQDSTTTWIEQAYLTDADSIRVITGNSNADATNYVIQELQKAPHTAGNYKVDISNGQLAVALNNTEPVVADTATWRITIYTDKYVNDSRYCKAAVEAIQQFTGHKIKLTIATSPAALPTQQDWLFWLSTQPVPEKYSAAKLLRYDSGKAQVIQSYIKAANTTGDAEPVSLYKRVVLPADQDLQATWQDGFGNAVLAEEKKNGQEVYHFYSRFDPSWNDLPWSSQFPALLLQLFTQNTGSRGAECDRRAIATEQLQPQVVSNKDIHEKETMAETTALSNIFWLLLFVVFLLERIVSFTTKKRTVNG